MESYNLAIREGLRNSWRERTLSLAMAGCVATAVFAVGAFGLLEHNVNFLLEQWESRVELVAFLSHGLSEHESQQVLNKILRLPDVSEARLVTGRESWEELFSDIGSSLDLSDIPLDEVLPSTIVIKLSEGKRNPTAIKQVSARIAALDGIAEVKFEEMLLKRYMQFRGHIARFTMAMSVLLALVFGIIIVNIASLSGTARKNEVRTLRMLGASPRFIKRILATESITQGVAGSAVGIALLGTAVALFSAKTGASLQSPAGVFVLAFAVGPTVALLAGWFSFRAARTIVVAILLAISSVDVIAQTGQPPDAEVAEYRQELKKLQLELDRSRADRERIGMQERALLSDLEATEKEINSLTREIAAGEASIASNKAAIRKAKLELSQRESVYEQSRNELEKWLRLLCNQREPTLIEVVLYNIPQSDLTRRREIISLLAGEATEAFEQARRFRMAVLREQESLNKRVELDTIYTEAARLRAERSREKIRQREELLAKLGEKKTIYGAAISDLETSARKLQELIETQSAMKQALPAGSTPFAEMKGLLPWPVEGVVTVPFGRVKNPDSTTYTRHLGWDMTARAGSQVRAIHDCVVVYSDWFKGYGKLIIVDHGDGYSSVYAHCSEILVQRGDIVRAGQPIAHIGETGSLKGPFLYFEIRENGTPVDPTGWLPRRSINAAQPQ